MASPQRAIFAPGAHHYALEYGIRGPEDPSAVRAALASLHLDSVLVGVGPALWRAWSPANTPEELHPFEPVEGISGFRAPATQGDLLFWIQGDSIGASFDTALEIGRALSGIAELRLDLRGFEYHDSRDLTGFIDGTANPEGDGAREAAKIPEGSPGVGGSFVLSQRWVHDLRLFNSLTVAEQERVIGRTKPDSVELQGSAMPADSHVSRTDVSRNGRAVKIYRKSFPYGTVAEHGLYFLAFSSELWRFRFLLDSMFGLSADGVHDQLLKFTRPVTGSYWFAPSIEDLEDALRG